MPYFKVNVRRTQVQSQTFVIKAEEQSDLEKKLNEFDFGHIDSMFDEGEVDSIDYEVVNISPCERSSFAFASEVDFHF